MLSNVEEIKSKLDIVDVIQEYFPLKQAGVNFKANCPFHQEKTPSFMVSRERQMWYCFGCNIGGDMFTFLQKMENIEFPEALKIFAGKSGVELKYQDPKTTNLKTRILNINEVAAAWFNSQLFTSAAGARALKYLQETRGLDDKIIKDWQLGYALDSWDALGNHLKSRGFLKEEIIQSGLVVLKSGGYEYRDRFRDRVMFPILDYHGNAVGFTGRTMKTDEQAKYVNTPQTMLYNKSEVIFGLYYAKQLIKEKDAVVIVEGNMDVIGSFQSGVKNVVAVSGTALTREQIKILQRYTNNIIFSFDADAAGLRAAERSISLAWQAGANVKVAPIPKDLAKDPDELARKDPAAWLNLVANALPAMDYFFNLNLADYQPDNIENKKIVAKNLLNLIIQLANPIEQDFYLKKLSEKLNVMEATLRDLVKNAKNRMTAQQPGASAQSSPNTVRPTDEKSARALHLLALMLLDRDYASYISESFPSEYLPMAWQEPDRLLVIYYTKQTTGESSADPIDFLIKNNPRLTSLANSLIMKKEELRELSYAEAVGEIKQLIRKFKEIFIKNRNVLIKKEIQDLESLLPQLPRPEERAPHEEKIKELMAEFNELSAALKDTDF